MGFSVINHPAIGLPGYPQKGRSHPCNAALQRLGARTSPSKVRDGKRLFCWFLGHGDNARVVWWCLLHRSSVSTIGDTRINKLRAVEIRIPNASWLPLILVTGLWFLYFHVFSGTKTVVMNQNQAFPCCFFIPKGSKRCCIASNAINVTLESAPLRSFKHFRLKIFVLRCALHH